MFIFTKVACLNFLEWSIESLKDIDIEIIIMIKKWSDSYDYTGSEGITIPR